MKKYCIYIKSHTEAPDYEDECRAESEEKASKIFWERMPVGGEDLEGNEIEGRESWSPQDLIQYITSE